MRHLKGHVMGVIKATINISAVALVIAQAAGPRAPLKDESKSGRENDKRQISLDQGGKGPKYPVAVNDRVAFVPCKAMTISNRTITAISPAVTVNRGAQNKAVKARFRPAFSNRNFLSD
jgi:hypothetical protein